jgi:hypothetical protein
MEDVVVGSEESAADPPKAESGQDEASTIKIAGSYH